MHEDVKICHKVDKLKIKSTLFPDAKLNLNTKLHFHFGGKSID